MNTGRDSHVFAQLPAMILNIVAFSLLQARYKFVDFIIVKCFILCKLLVKISIFYVSLFDQSSFYLAVMVTKHRRGMGEEYLWVGFIFGNRWIRYMIEVSGQTW